MDVREARHEHQVRFHYLLRVEDVLEDLLPVEREVAHLVAMNEDVVLRDLHDRGGLSQLALELILLRAVRDGLLTHREGGVEDLGALLDELRSRASAPELPVVRVGRENHHTFCLHLQHLCAMPSVGYRTAARSPGAGRIPGLEPVRRSADLRDRRRRPVHRAASSSLVAS